MKNENTTKFKPENAEEQSTFSVRVSRSLLNKLDAIAESERRSRNFVVTEIIEQALRKGG